MRLRTPPGEKSLIYWSKMITLRRTTTIPQMIQEVYSSFGSVTLIEPAIVQGDSTYKEISAIMTNGHVPLVDT